MLNSDIDFLIELQRSIWRKDGSVSDSVLNTVFDIVEKNRLGIIIQNACMGFGVGITIYNNPIYPGVEPEGILKINNRHLGDGNKKFNDGWEIFYPFVKQNENLLLEPLKEKSYYDY